MLGIDDGFFLQIPERSKPRILHSAKMVGANDNVYTAEIEDGSVSLAEGQEIFIYYEVRQKFVRHAARISAVFDDEPMLSANFTTVGEPVPAESRQHYRVSTATSKLTVALGNKGDFKLLDVSATGFSILADKPYDIGTTLDTEVRYDGQCYSGKACVQSVRDLSRGRVRHGLHCVDENRSGAGLAKGLQYVTMAIQRKQLRRLAR